MTKVTAASSKAGLQQGIQSVEVAAPLLRALADAASALPLSTLAKSAGMPAAKAHRYLVSLIRSGLVVQQPHNGEYDLGPLALELGLAALARLDAVKLAEETLAALRDVTEETVALAVWGNQGPTYVRLLQSHRPVTINLQIGSVMPLTYTATGLCFAAFRHERDTAALLKQELQRNRRTQIDAPQSLDELAPKLAEVRTHGVARIIGHLDPAQVRRPSSGRVVERLLAGFNAFAAPVFGHDGHMQFALTVVGSAAHIAADWDGEIANAVRQHALMLSRRLGWQP